MRSAVTISIHRVGCGEAARKYHYLYLCRRDLWKNDCDYYREMECWKGRCEWDDEMHVCINRSAKVAAMREMIDLAKEELRDMEAA